MLALIAGQGGLPNVLAKAASEANDRPLICEMRGFPSDVSGEYDRLPFRIEQLGSFIAELRTRGVKRLCMAGAVKRPPIDPSKIDTATLPLVPRIQRAIAMGDDGALREVIAIFEEAGLEILAAHDLVPSLLPASGFPTVKQPDAETQADAVAGEVTVAAMGAMDSGQACLVKSGKCIAQEGPDGTDAMINGANASVGALLFKAPKPNQDRRADLPTIGPNTAESAIRAGLRGIVIESGGVLVIDAPDLIERLDAAGLFLWVRPKGARA